MNTTEILPRFSSVRQTGEGHSFNKLRAVGLSVWQVGRCHYVSGEELIGAMRRVAEREARQ